MLARLDAGDEHCRYLAGEPHDPGWYPLDQVLANDDLLDGWYREIRDGEARGRRDVAGSYMASWLSGVVAETVAAALTTEERAWPLDPAGLAVHHHEEGWFDGIAVRSTRLWVLPGDPDAGHPESDVVDDLAALRSVLAAELVEVITPIFAAVRRRAPFGIRGMWGSLADGIVATALWRAHRTGGDVTAVADAAQALVEAVAGRVPALTARPRVESVAWRGGTGWFAAKGSCCLWYKTFDGTPDPRGEGYCTSCPFRDDDSRRARWASHFDELDAVARGGAA